MFGNLIPHPAVGKALQDAIDSGEYLGYNHSSGMEKAREAVAQHLSKYSEKNKLSYDVSNLDRLSRSNEEESTSQGNVISIIF